MKNILLILTKLTVPEEEKPEKSATKLSSSQITLLEADCVSVFEPQADGSQRFRFIFSTDEGKAIALKNLPTEKMLEEVSLSETGSDRFLVTNALIDTGSDLTIVSPEWCKRINAKIGPWEGPQLWMANSTTASVNGVAEIEVSNYRGKAAGTALVMPMNGYDLLLGNNFLRQFGTLKIDYTTDGHQITLGEELPVGAVEEEAKPIPLRVAKGRRITPDSIARVDVQGMWEKDETPETASAWLLTPSNDLLGRKRLTTAHFLLPGSRPIVAYVANFTDRDTVEPCVEPYKTDTGEAKPISKLFAVRKINFGREREPVHLAQEGDDPTGPLFAEEGLSSILVGDSQTPSAETSQDRESDITLAPENPELWGEIEH